MNRTGPDNSVRSVARRAAAVRLDLRAHLCMRCSKHWCTNGIGDVVIRFCPDCIPLVTHVLSDEGVDIMVKQERDIIEQRIRGIRSHPWVYRDEEKHQLQSRRRTA